MALTSQLFTLTYGTHSSGTDGGRYYKFSDGTLICEKRHTVSNTAVSTAWGNVYCSANIDMSTWAYTFTSTPTVVATFHPNSNSGDAYLCGIFNTSTTAIGVTSLNRGSSGTGISGYIHVIGIGRWK